MHVDSDFSSIFETRFRGYTDEGKGGPIVPERNRVRVLKTETMSRDFRAS